MRSKNNHKNFLSISLVVPMVFLMGLTGCRSHMTEANEDKIVSINLIDRNGMSETISSKDRIAKLQKTDFLAPQPYQKVLRIYARDKEGNTHSTITSYHPNGQLKQFLDAVNNRANGYYREWHPNGRQKIESHVIGGIADINSQAEQSWLFDGTSRAWDEEGHLLAEVNYSKGVLEGPSFYYHPNGKIWKQMPFEKNVLNGEAKVYLESGDLFQQTPYLRGEKDGICERYWSEDKLAYRERYQEGRLLEAVYYDREGALVSEIVAGKGFRALFGKLTLLELHEYSQGVPEGIVKIFDEQSRLIRTYCTHEGEKEGEEIDYYPSSAGESLQPKLLMTWSHGVLQGTIQSWFVSGQLESRKEMSQNKKNGLLSSWYENGSLMMVEEYENDKLQKGQYYERDGSEAISRVKGGQGIATLYDAQGNFLKKVRYQDGRPQVE